MEAYHVPIYICEKYPPSEVTLAEILCKPRSRDVRQEEEPRVLVGEEEGGEGVDQLLGGGEGRVPTCMMAGSYTHGLTRVRSAPAWEGRVPQLPLLPAEGGEGVDL